MSVEAIRELISRTGKYTLGQEITEGANAYAFQAHHIPLDQQVFLKILDADPDGDLYAEPRMLVEATKAENGESNLVRVYDAERLGENYVLVAMEYVEGGSILQRLAYGPFSVMEAVRTAMGILHGLAQLHKVNLVHRDIKPANILVSSKYGRLWPKIADFGSVAYLDHSGISVTASRHSSLYVPPEGWMSPSQYDVRSDLYQVGIVLFEMANGPLPYEHECYLDRQAREELRKLGAKSLRDIHDCEACCITNGTIARAASGKGVATTFGKKQPYIPAPLMKIINRATKPERDHRYQSISQMIGALAPLRLPDWQPTNTSEQYRANAWAGWNWLVEKAADGSWVIQRSRKTVDKFRRWKVLDNEKAAFCLVMRAES